jgi:hypothetical protein
MPLPTTSCEAERYLPKVSVIRNKFGSNMPEERLDYLSILSTENITKSLFYEEEDKE